MYGGEHHAEFSGTVLSQGFEDRVAVERRQVDVEQQQRHRAASVQRAQVVERLPAVAVMYEAIPAGLEPEGEQVSEGGVVLDYDDFGDVAGRWVVRGVWCGVRGSRGGRLLCEQGGGEAPDVSPRGRSARRRTVRRLRQPLLGRLLELGGDHRSLGEPERPG